MGKTVGIDSIWKEGIEASMTSDDLLAHSPASVVGPSTPEAAAHRRMVSAFLLDSFSADCDEDDMEFVTYDDNDVVLDTMEEPVAMSRVRAYAFAQGSRSLESKVTLESARAKLDRVKATREKHVTKRKLETFLSGHMDAELRQQSKKVKATRISVERARAKLESVKIKEILNPKSNRHVNTYIRLPPARTRRTASEAANADNELPLEGVWVQHAKVKLEAAKEKKSKPSRKRSSGVLGSKKRGVQRKSSSEISCTDRKNEGDEFDSANVPDSIWVTLDCTAAKDASIKGRQRKASKQRAVRVSERIANSRLRMQQGLVTLNVKTEIGNGKTKLRRNKRSRQEESRSEICTDLCGKKRGTEATASVWDIESSPALPMDITSLELTPSKRGDCQRVLDDVCRPGARLSSSVECIPPVSPYGLIQEHLYQDPWKVLVACMLLNKTGGRQMHKVIWDFFELCPDPETCVSIETEKIGLVIHSLGLQNKRAKTLQRFSQDYLGTTWTNVTQLHGIGEYARDAYAIFCEGRWQDVQPNDIVLNKYWQWLSDTQGLGCGFSQIE